MSGKRAILIAIAAGLGVLGIALLARLMNETPLVIRGAVVTQNPDPTKQLPIGDVTIRLAGAGLALTAKSDDSGFFRIALPAQVRPGEPLMLQFEHAEYQPVDLRAAANDRLYIARLEPIARPAPTAARHAEVKLANIVVRYSINTTTTVNVGSAVRTFEVVNKGDVPCQGQRPCSPDGKWKAAVGTAEMDAGAGNEYHNARASCIAGPCPFTRIEDNNFNRDERILRVSFLNWSDTATFLVEAEVFHPTVSSVVRQSYPVVFDQALTFTLPASAEGVSIEAQLNGETVVFPLGPALYLSWATCQAVVNKDASKVYRCELKPGYRL